MELPKHSWREIVKVAVRVALLVLFFYGLAAFAQERPAAQERQRRLDNRSAAAVTVLRVLEREELTQGRAETQRSQRD